MDKVLFSLTILLVMPDDVSSNSAKCKTLSSLENGSIDPGKSTASCDIGYSLTPSYTSLSCSTINGQSYSWTPSPSCSSKQTSTSTFSATQTAAMNTIKQTTSSLETKTMSMKITTSDIASSLSPSFETHLTTTVPQQTSILTSEIVTLLASSTKQDTLSPTTHQPDFLMTSTEVIMPTATQSSISVSATTSPTVMDELKDEKTSDTRAVYIAVPVVVCVIAIIAVIVVLIWRRKKKQPTVLKREKIPAAPLTNKSYEVNALDRQCSLINFRLSRDSGYAEITSVPAHLEEASDNVYNTIDNLPEDKPGSNKTYGHLKQHGKGLTDFNYSRISPNSMDQEARTDNTYAHTTSVGLSEEAKKSPDVVDATYNRLHIQTATNERKAKEEAEKETDVEYNHAQARGQDSENADTYSHLNNALAASPKHPQKRPIHLNVIELSTENPDIQSYALEKETKPRQHDYDVVSPKGENTISSNAKFKQQAALYNNQNHNRDCQTLKFAKKSDITPYEFARNFNKLSDDDLVKPGPNQIEMQTTEVKMKRCAEDNDYEKAVGTPHSYFILEPEKRPSDNETSFRVVEEELSETRHTDDNEEPENHQYFTLERVDT